MSASETHNHSDHSMYYLDQMMTVLVSAAIGVVAILIHQLGMINLILAPEFHFPVLLGGIVLVLIVFVRSITLYQEFSYVQGHHHEETNHEHDHCDHSHSDCHHNHEHASHEHHHHHHDHEHGWNPAKYIILLLPVVLYMLNLPNKGFSKEALERALGKDNVELALTGTENLTIQDGETIELRFRELADAAASEQQRAFLDGKLGRLKGQYAPLNVDKQFTMFRLKMNCCAADAIPLKVRIISPEPLTDIQMGDKIQVEGRIRFLQPVGSKEFIPVIFIESMDNIRTGNDVDTFTEYEF